MHRLLLGWILLSIAVFGCKEPGAGSEHEDGDGNQYVPVESSLPVEAGTDEVHTVEIKGMKFVPEVLKVSKGDTVVWINKGIVDHDVTEQDSNSWTSGKMVPGSSWKMAVEKSGDYYCSIHVVMKGRVIVEAEEPKLP